MQSGLFSLYFQVVFEQGDVFVHTTVPASTLHDNIIRGKLVILKKVSGNLQSLLGKVELPHQLVISFEI